MNQMNWKLRPDPPREVALKLAESLSQKSDFPLPLAEILAQRGITSFAHSKSYFAPDLSQLHDPLLMQDMALAVNRLAEAKEKNEKILVYGDYDVDGTTSVTLMVRFLDSWGFNYDYYIPDRYTEGYGISYVGIDYAKKIGASLFISLDCGIKAVDKIKYANQKGIDVIICDHHTPGEVLPPALAILDPKRSTCPYPFKQLTGCGIGYKLSQAVHEVLVQNGAKPPKGDFDPKIEYLDLVTLSIACDIVPLEGENRTIAYHGLKKLHESPLPGIKAIMNLSDRERSWDISDLVFFIGPHINAAGRLGHAKEAVAVLLGTENGNQQLTSALFDANNARKELDRQITEEALQIIARDATFPQKCTTVLYHQDWHKGVIGIVASRLVEQHYRPTVILTQSGGKLVGSARSVSGFDLYQALEHCTPLLLQFGGHKYAAGLTLKEEVFPDFCRAFDKAVAAQILPEQKSPTLTIDRPLSFSQIDARLVRLLHRMEPFGPKNMRPVFMAKNVEVTDADILKGVHIRFTLKQGGYHFRAIGFNMAQKWKELNALHLDIAFQPSFNTWNNRTTIDLKLKDFRLPND